MWSPLITHSSVDDPNKSFGVDIEFRYMILSKKNVITYYYPVEYGVGGGWVGISQILFGNYIMLVFLLALLFEIQVDNSGEALSLNIINII